MGRAYQGVSPYGKPRIACLLYESLAYWSYVSLLPMIARMKEHGLGRGGSTTRGWTPLKAKVATADRGASQGWVVPSSDHPFDVAVDNDLGRGPAQFFHSPGIWRRCCYFQSTTPRFSCHSPGASSPIGQIADMGSST